MQEPPQQGIIHSSTPSLPPSLPVAGLVYVCICTCASMRPCVRVSVRVSVRMHVHTYIHTYIQYPQKIHIKDTCTRVSWGMWLFLILKIIFADPIDTKNHPTNVRAPALSFTTSLGEFMCKPMESKISLSNWRPKTTVCLATLGKYIAMYLHPSSPSVRCFNERNKHRPPLYLFCQLATSTIQSIQIRYKKGKTITKIQASPLPPLVSSHHPGNSTHTHHTLHAHLCS